MSEWWNEGDDETIKSNDYRPSHIYRNIIASRKFIKFIKFFTFIIKYELHKIASNIVAIYI